MIRRYRTPESIKKRLDLMLKNGEVILDHGCGSYTFDHYDYYEPSATNHFESMLIIYYRDYDTKTTSEYMRVTERDLRKPTENDVMDWFVDCYWEKKYPTLLYMREYQVRY